MGLISYHFKLFWSKEHLFHYQWAFLNTSAFSDCFNTSLVRGLIALILLGCFNTFECVFEAGHTRRRDSGLIQTLETTSPVSNWAMELAAFHLSGFELSEVTIFTWSTEIVLNYSLLGFIKRASACLKSHEAPGISADIAFTILIAIGTSITFIRHTSIE